MPPLILNGTTGISGVDGSAGTPSYQGTDTNTGIFYPAADTIAFAEGGTEVMRIDSSGNVGIGISSPTQRLDVQAAAGSQARFKTATGTDASYITVSNNAVMYVGLDNSAGSAITGAAYAGFMYSSANAPLIFINNATEKMRIAPDGNVGIGTSSPSSRLEIVGVNPKLTINANDTVNGRNATLSLIQGFSGDPSGTCQIMYGASNSNTAGVLTFVEGDGTERMRLDSSGNVGIGTSSVFDSNTRLELSKSGNCQQFISSTDASGVRIYLSAQGSTSANFGAFSNHPLSFRTNDTERMRITSGGDLIVGTTATINSERLNVRQSSSANTTGIAVGYGTSAGQFRSMSIISTNVMTFNNGSNEATLTAAGAWTNASDARLKNSIVDIKYGLETVLATQPRSYKMNDLEGDYIGFVAQELQPVIPEVVSGDPETQLGVDYGSLVAVAFKAIQEQQAIITDLKQRIETLEAK